MEDKQNMLVIGVVAVVLVIAGVFVFMGRANQTPEDMETSEEESMMEDESEETTGKEMIEEETGMDEEAMGEPVTIVEIASGNPDFSTLVVALQEAELDGVLMGEGPFTVFAPTNEAFEALPAGTLDSLLADKEALVWITISLLLPIILFPSRVQNSFAKRMKLYRDGYFKETLEERNAKWNSKKEGSLKGTSSNKEAFLYLAIAVLFVIFNNILAKSGNLKWLYGVAFWWLVILSIMPPRIGFLKWLQALEREIGKPISLGKYNDL